MRTLYTSLILFAAAGMLPSVAVAERGKLMADCIIQLKGAKEGQTRLTVMPGTNAAYVLTPSSTHFVLELSVDETYLLTFEHPGCVTKQLYVDATVPVDLRSTDFEFPLKVVLEYHETPFAYAGPVGSIFYEHSITDFTYSTDHRLQPSAHLLERMSALRNTGKDPRASTVGYTASTTDPRLPKPGTPAPAAEWGTMAPVVSRVAPKVHRLAGLDSVSQHSEPPAPPVVAVVSQPAPTVSVEPLLAALPVPMPVPVVVGAPAETPAPPVVSVVEEATVPVLESSATSVEAAVYTYEVLEEPLRVTTIIRIAKGMELSTEFRRVAHQYGAVYFFQDGRSISALSYDEGTALARALEVREAQQQMDMPQ